MSGATGGRVVVRHGGRVWFLRPGESLTIGRDEGNAVRLTDPEISRHACLLRAVPGMVLVINQSGRKPLVLRPPGGEDRRVAPRGATTSLPHRVFDVVLAGRDDEPVCVDARGLDAPAGHRVSRHATLLTPGQRVALIALCEPVLIRSGDAARPRSTPELAARLGWTPGYAPNVVKDVRHRLAQAGVPGLLPAADTPAGGSDLRVALARWAVDSGAVGREDLAGLPPPPDRGAPRRRG